MAGRFTPVTLFEAGRAITANSPLAQGAACEIRWHHERPLVLTWMRGRFYIG